MLIEREDEAIQKTLQDVGYELKFDNIRGAICQGEDQDELQGNALEAAILTLGVDPVDKEKRRWASAGANTGFFPIILAYFLGNGITRP